MNTQRGMPRLLEDRCRIHQLVRVGFPTQFGRLTDQREVQCYGNITRTRLVQNSPHHTDKNIAVYLNMPHGCDYPDCVEQAERVLGIWEGIWQGI